MKRITAFILVIIITISSVMYMPMTVYASSEHGGGGSSDNDHRNHDYDSWCNMSFNDKFDYIYRTLLTCMGAIYTLDDDLFDSTSEEFDNFIRCIKNDEVTMDPDGNIDISENFMKLLYDAVKNKVDVESAKFNDSLVQEHNSGNIHSFTVNHNRSYKSGGATIESKYKYTFSLKGRVAGFYDSNNGYKIMRFISERSGYTKECTDATYRDGVLQNQSESKDHYDFTLNTYFELETQYGISCTLFSHTPVPIFATRSEAEDYIYHNKYGSAQNYNSTGKNIYITNKFKNYTPAAIKVDARTVNYYNQYYSEVVNNITEGITPEELEKLLDDLWHKIEELLKNPPKQEDEEKDPATADLTGISKLLKEIKDLLEDIRTYVKKIRFWSALDTLTDIGDLISDWIQFGLGLKKDAAGVIGGVASGVADEVTTMTTKFPFSIPWDLLYIIDLMAMKSSVVTTSVNGEPIYNDAVVYTPTAPVFVIPFKIQSINFQYDIVIDLKNGVDTSILSDACRSVLAIIYAFGLLKFTPEVIKVLEED